MGRGVDADGKPFIGQLTDLLLRHRRDLRRRRRGGVGGDRGAAPCLTRLRAKIGDGRRPVRARHGVEPEEPLAADRLRADEHRGRQPVALQDRPRQLEHAAVAVVEGDEHRTLRQRASAGLRVAQRRKIDRMARLRDHPAVRVEDVRGDVQIGERHRAGIGRSPHAR